MGFRVWVWGFGVRDSVCGVWILVEDIGIEIWDSKYEYRIEHMS